MILVVYQREYQPETNTDHLKGLFAFCRMAYTRKQGHAWHFSKNGQNI